jgi:hypothetical protein
MAGEIDDLIILYDSSVEITGRLHYKDNLKTKEGSFGPQASFAILVEKPKKDKIARHYIYARAFGEKLVEKLKRIEKGTFIRVLGELESGFGGTYINVKVLNPVSTVELQDMLSRQKPAEEVEDIFNDLEEAEEFEELEESEELLDEEPEELEEESNKIEESPEEPEEKLEKPETTKTPEKEPEKKAWSGWKKKERRGIF